MNNEINSISQEPPEPENITRRNLLIGGGILAGTAAAVAADLGIIQNSDPTLSEHLTSAAKDTARVLTTEPAYMIESQYTAYYQEHADSIPYSEDQWVNVVAPGLDKFFNLYFAKPLMEGFPVLDQVGKDMNMDPENLLLAASYWGERKIQNEGRVLLEKGTNLAQTIIAGELDTNLVDNAVQTINPSLAPVQSVYDSSALNPIIPQFLRKQGSKRIRTVGPNDADPRAYSFAIASVIRREELPIDYFGERMTRGAVEIAKLSGKLDSERSKGIPNEKTVSDFVQASRVMEGQITRNERDLVFGTRLFGASIRHREYLMLDALGLDSFEDLSGDRKSLIRLMLLATMDDYPNAIFRFPYDPKIGGQSTYPKEVIDGFLNDTKKMEIEKGDDVLDPKIWPPEIADKVNFVRRLTADSAN